MNCFIITPFKEPYNEIYSFIIKDTIIEGGFTPIRADNIFTPGIIINDIFEGIKNSSVIIADITERNPNVYYELGIAHAMKKTVILLSQDVSDLPFDIQQYRVLKYDNTIKGANSLKNHLREFLKKANNG